MLKDFEIDKPILETDRLIIRPLNENDVADLKEWLGRDEIYTYWGRKASRNEKNPELMFAPDPRPWVKRKPSPDFDWGIVLKETNKMIGMIKFNRFSTLSFGNSKHIPFRRRNLLLFLFLQYCFLPLF